MYFYTIQTKKAWLEFLKTKELKVYSNFIINDFEKPYQWMIKQYNQRIGFMKHYPIWLWQEKPDLRFSGHLEKNTEGVLIKIDISKSQVLLSDFNAWHCVLNNWYCTLNNFEEISIQKKEFFIAKETTWERIFDLEKIKHSEHYSSKQIIQGICPKIDFHQVVNIKNFIAR